MNHMPATLDKPSLLRLKKQAHHLKPLVQSGAAGLSTAVLEEIDRGLTDHELIKIKLAADDKTAFETEVEQTCQTLNAVCVQRIGRTATLYRSKPDHAGR